MPPQDREAVTGELERLRAAIEQQNDVQRKSFDTLYEELKQYKDDFVYQSETVSYTHLTLPTICSV